MLGKLQSQGAPPYPLIISGDGALENLPPSPLILSSDGSLDNLQSQGVSLISFLPLNLLCLAPVLWFGFSKKQTNREAWSARFVA